MGIFDSDLKETLVRVEGKIDSLLKRQEEEVKGLRDDLLAATSPQAYALRRRAEKEAGNGTNSSGSYTSPPVTTDSIAAHLRLQPLPRTPAATHRHIITTKEGEN